LKKTSDVGPTCQWWRGEKGRGKMVRSVKLEREKERENPERPEIPNRRVRVPLG
jgi:hypothetical protein